MHKTFFAPAPKATPQALHIGIAAISNHPIIDSLLNSVGGVLAVLNEERQILAVNDAFLTMLGLEDQRDVLALRPGEAIHCIHAREAPHGCGTTQFCSTCGAAIAMVTCLAENTPSERICALTAKRAGKIVELSLAVRAQPLTIDGNRYILLLLHDITKEQFLTSLERTFFHDLNNIISGLLGRCQMYGLRHGNPAEIRQITDLVLRIGQEIAIQKTLSHFGENGLKPIRQTIKGDDILAEIDTIFSNHPAAAGKTIVTRNNAPGRVISTDISLLIRVLSNMVTNALEATADGDTITISIDDHARGMAIKVWNRAVIPEPVKLRIFQRHFTTKAGSGRGLGTYSMKLFGEQYLGGEVGFTSTPEEGTTFFLTV